jgi:RNA polymerase sigma-70 factor (ECF subfamily)
MFCMGKNDHAAVRAILGGDKEAYGALVVRHSQSLFRVAFRITGNEADADDVVQEAFLRGYQKLGSFALRSSFGTWIYRIAVRCALDKLNSRRAGSSCQGAEQALTGKQPVQIAEAAAGPENLLLSGEIGALLDMALNSLTPAERTAFVMRHMEDRTMEEIAAAMGIQVNAAKQAVFRAVQKLRTRIASLRVTR